MACPDHLSNLPQLSGGPRGQDSSPHSLPSLTAPSPQPGLQRAGGQSHKPLGAGASPVERGQEGLRSSICNQRLVANRSLASSFQKLVTLLVTMATTSPVARLEEGRPRSSQNLGSERGPGWPEAIDPIPGPCPLGVRYPFSEKKLTRREDESALLGSPQGGLARGQLAGSETINKPSFP